jgi:hypothetical protein
MLVPVINALLSVSQTYAPVLRGTANPGCFATGWGGRRAGEMQKLACKGDITPKGGQRWEGSQSGEAHCYQPRALWGDFRDHRGIDRNLTATAQ